MKLLCISNGHGEDVIAVRILKSLRSHFPNTELAAMPIVGEGEALQRAGIALQGPTQAMPSGGFIYMDGRQLAKDVQSGLVRLTLAQIRSAREWANQGGCIFAVGDVVPLAIAYLSGAPYAFLGTAKSEYWLRDETGPLPHRPWFEGWAGSVYLPWERWLMSRSRCRVAFVRDALTADTLKRFGIAAEYVGNPMMDNLMPHPERLTHLVAGLNPTPALTLALLPGSRSPEAERNWQAILQAVESVQAQYADKPLWFLAAISPALDPLPFHQALLSQGWATTSNSAAMDYTAPYFKAHSCLRMTQTAFVECLHLAEGAIATAGTATEQLVGLGKPAFTLPGEGPQFTRAFAEVQARLLGEAVVLVDIPDAVGQAVHAVFEHSDRLQQICQVGQQRMGLTDGKDAVVEDRASGAIARYLSACF